MGKTKYITDEQIATIGLSKEQATAVDALFAEVANKNAEASKEEIEALKDEHVKETEALKAEHVKENEALNAELEEFRKLAKTEMRIVPDTYIPKRDKESTYRFKKGIIKFKFKGEELDANDVIKDSTKMEQLISINSQLIEKVQ